jgi:oligopeptide/dipeptide ABC transporter ATP-binding protein
LGDILRIEDLAMGFRTYDGFASVIDHVNIRVAEREVVGLVGESGCGKTITAKAVMGILPKQSRVTGGKILLNGIDLFGLSPRELHEVRGKQMAWIPQDPMTSLNPVFTVGDQMIDLLMWRGTYSVSPIKYYTSRRDKATMERLKNQAIEMLRKVKISGPERVLQSFPVQLSGGMRQRVLIAMALIGKPNLIIADEPGTGLDVSIQSEILSLMEEKVKEEGIAQIFITHDLAVARRICDRIYVMYGGTVAETCGNDELFANPKHPYTLGLLESVPKLTGGVGKGIKGMIPDYYSPPNGCRFNPRCPYVMEICRTERPPLFKVNDSHEAACFLVKEGAN